MNAPATKPAAERLPVATSTAATSTTPRMRRRRLWQVAGGAVLVGAVCAGALGWRWASVQAAFLRYEPAAGDVIFQSLPHGPIVWAIEGVTDSPYSHCGIVAKQHGRWIVYEAYGEVSATPLRTFLLRGRGGGFAVYRLRSPYREHVSRTLECCTAYLGRPYDIRYRLDDETIYCSELVYKAYRDATHGGQLGGLVRFGDMNWRPYRSLIERVEGGAVPVDREMITPVELARAAQLEPVFSHNIRVERGDPRSDAVTDPPARAGDGPVTRATTRQTPAEGSEEHEVAGEDRPHAE